MAQKKTTSTKATAKKTGTKGKPTRKRRATQAKAKKAAPRKVHAPAPKPGTTLTREFKGKKHVVKVTADGYVYGGKTYSSLTAVAKAITKYPSISGPRFFGTDAAAQKKGG